jgi:hypothetical protein
MLLMARLRGRASRAISARSRVSRSSDSCSVGVGNLAVVCGGAVGRAGSRRCCRDGAVLDDDHRRFPAKWGRVGLRGGIGMLIGFLGVSMLVTPGGA